MDPRTEDEVQKEEDEVGEVLGPCSFQVFERRGNATTHMEREERYNDFNRFALYQSPTSDSLP